MTFATPLRIAAKHEHLLHIANIWQDFFVTVVYLLPVGGMPDTRSGYSHGLTKYRIQ